MRRHVWAVGLLLSAALSACGGGGGGATPTPTPVLAANQTTVTVEQNPAITAAYPNLATVNLPYVTVTVCDGYGTCKAIDHVVVDTGSYGLRLLQSAVSGLNLPVQTQSGSAAQLGECAAFIGGYMWGSVRQATVRIAGESTTSAVPIQVMADPAWTYTVPTSCTNATASGTNVGTLPGIGGNGLLGIGHRVADGQLYYACTAGSCSQISLATSQQVSNPVAMFASDSNGSILQMPALPDTGLPVAQGTLTFGVGTQADNSIAGFSLLPLDAAGNFTANLQGIDYAQSFADSGSNFYFLTLQGVPPVLHDGTTEYAPAVATSFDITLKSNATPVTPIPAQIRVIDPTKLDYRVNLAFDDIAAIGSAGSADLGLPFFYGRQTALVIEGRSSPQGSGPLLAVH